MANFKIYKYTIVNKTVDYDVFFHLGGKTGSLLGTEDFDSDVINEIEIDFALQDELLHGMEIAKSVKVNFNINALQRQLGTTFVANLFRGSEETDEEIAIPISEFVSNNRPFAYPNRIRIVEKDKSGTYSSSNEVIFDGVQKTEFSGKKITSNNLELNFICSGSWILQQIQMDDSAYVYLNYDEINTVTNATYEGIRTFNNHRATTTQTMVLWNKLFGATTRRIEELNKDLPDIVYGSTSFKEIITRIQFVGSLFYNAIIRSSGDNFILTNTDTNNALFGLNLYSTNTNAVTSSNFTPITSYNARIKTALFDYYSSGGNWVQYQSDNLLKNIVDKNAYDFINSLVEMYLGKASFYYGSNQAILRFHLSGELNSNTYLDNVVNYAVGSRTELINDIESDYKPSGATNVFLNDKEYSYRKTRRSQAPTNEINLKFTNIPKRINPETRGRFIAGERKDAWVCEEERNMMYINYAYNNASSNTTYALIGLNDYCQIKLDSSTTISAQNTAKTIPSDAPRKNGRDRFIKSYNGFVRGQENASGLPFVMGLAYNKIYNNLTKIEIEVPDRQCRDFLRVFNLTQKDNIINNHISNLIPSKYVCNGVKSKLDGLVTLTLVSINV